LFGPDGLAPQGLAGPPALGELGDKEKAASALVEGAGLAEVRGGAAAVGDLADDVRSQIRRSWIGLSACLIALVTSSLTTSPVTNAASSRPQPVSRMATCLRASATMAGSAGKSQVATRSPSMA